MIKNSTFEFLKALDAHNSKDWVDEHRKDYHAAKEDVIAFTQQLITTFGKHDETIAYLDPKKCITRLNRDMRFAKNRPPYKTDFFVVLNRKELHGITAGYFVHLQPGNCYVGAGAWNPLRDELKSFRQEIAYSLSEWEHIIGSKNFVSKFPSGIQGDGMLVKFLKNLHLMTQPGIG